MLITFSGLDGSGKTTLIANLTKNLQKSGHEVIVVTMYDDVSFYSYIRKVRDFFKNKDKGTTTTDVGQRSNVYGINPQDPKTDVSDKKGVVSKFIFKIIRNQAVRKCILLCDSMSLAIYRFRYEIFDKKILVIDRCLYDSLVDVADLNDKKWFFVKTLTKLLPEPTVPVFVDVSAQEAYRRKKEYPIDYMVWRRTAYQKVFSWVKKPIILYNDNLEKTLYSLNQAVQERVAGQ